MAPHTYWAFQLTTVHLDVSPVTICHSVFMWSHSLGSFSSTTGAPSKETLESLFGVDFVKSPLLARIHILWWSPSWVNAFQLSSHKESLLFLTFGTHFGREAISHFVSYWYYLTKSNGRTYILSISADHGTLRCLPSHYLTLSVHVEPLFGVVFIYYHGSPSKETLESLFGVDFVDPMEDLHAIN